MAQIEKVGKLFRYNIPVGDGQTFAMMTRDDGYIHATSMCQAAGKRVDKWRFSPETVQVVEFLMGRLNVSEDYLIQSKNGKDPCTQGTWVHPNLLLTLANWCSPILCIQIFRWVRELMLFGKVEMGKEKSASALDQQLKTKLSPFSNTNTDTDDVAVAEPDDATKRKRCGGRTHQTEEERFLPLSAFYKNKSSADGYARLCKECHLTGMYGETRNRHKPAVAAPPHDTSTHKWCNRCESVKQHDQFYQSTSTKDGLTANCKQCNTDQKRQQKLRKQQQQPQEA